MQKTNDNDMMTIIEVAEYSGFKLSYIYKLNSQNFMPRYVKNNGRKVFYKKADVVAMMQGIRIRSRQEIIKEEDLKHDYQKIVVKKIKKFER